VTVPIEIKFKMTPKNCLLMGCRKTNFYTDTKYVWSEAICIYTNSVCRT